MIMKELEYKRTHGRTPQKVKGNVNGCGNQMAVPQFIDQKRIFRIFIFFFRHFFSEHNKLCKTVSMCEDFKKPVLAKEKHSRPYLLIISPYNDIPCCREYP